VRYLLDTHVWVWLAENPERVGSRTRRELADLNNEREVSPVSTLEISRLLQLGLLRLKHGFAEWRTLSLAHLHATTAALTHEIAAHSYDLPGEFHSDPADRVLVATARLERLTLVTADDLILRYPHVKTLRADR
jgi:PIN domain nuclease of toxin-antitoxin system